MKYRALRLDTGNFSWGTEGERDSLPTNVYVEVFMCDICF